MRFVNPATGGYPMPTIGAFMQLLPKGFRGTPYRQTDATIFVVVEGHGRTRIGDTTFAWGPRDIFVVPSWAPLSHEAQDDAVLFSLSDRPAQKALGLVARASAISINRAVPSYRIRIGQIVPSSNTTMETEIPAILRGAGVRRA